MDKYEKRTQQKKAAIITAALDLFGRQGFSQVSIKELATAARVSQVSIYNYFGSKEALIGECAKQLMQETIQKAAAVLQTEQPFKEQLLVALALCSQQSHRSLNEYFSQQALADEVLQQLLTKEINGLKAQIYLRYIKAGKQAGAIAPELSDEIVLQFLMQASLPAEQSSSKSQEEMLQLLLYGLLGSTT